MPTISIDKRELMRLLGKNLTDSELEYEMAMLGVVPDKVSEEILVDVPPNRPDFLSVEGLARGLRYFLGLDSGLEIPKVHPGRYEARVEPETSEVRPYAVCAVVKDLDMNEELVRSLMQVQEKLHLTHSRNRRLASIGIYDLDQIKFPITYKVVNGDYAFVPLGESRKMTIEEIKKNHPKGREFADLVPGPRYVVWEDSQGQTLSFPPIINSAETAVTEDTKNLLIDVTGTRLNPVIQALNILVYLLAERGGKIYSVTVSGKTWPDLAPRDMVLDPKYANLLLGLDLSPGEIASFLKKMGFGAKAHGGKVYVKIPAYRVDILHPIDLVEDLAIAYRYDRFEPEVPKISTTASESRESKITRMLSEIMVGLGFLEVMNYHLASEEVLRNLVKKTGQLVRVVGSVNENYNSYRDSLLPQLLQILSQNKHHPYPQKLFEIGRTAVVNGNDIKEKLALAGVIADAESDYSTAKSTIEAIFKCLGKSVKFKETSNPTFMEGRTAKVMLEDGGKDEEVGVVGEVGPDILENFGIEMPVSGFELDLGFLDWKDW